MKKTIKSVLAVLMTAVLLLLAAAPATAADNTATQLVVSTDNVTLIANGWYMFSVVCHLRNPISSYIISAEDENEFGFVGYRITWSEWFGDGDSVYLILESTSQMTGIRYLDLSLIDEATGETVDKKTISVYLEPDFEYVNIGGNGLGDVNEDGALTVADARQCLRYAIKLDKVEMGSVSYTRADMDGDAAVTVTDARTILRAAINLQISSRDQYDMTVNTYAEAFGGQNVCYALEDINGDHYHEMIMGVSYGAGYLYEIYTVDYTGAISYAFYVGQGVEFYRYNGDIYFISTVNDSAFKLKDGTNMCFVAESVGDMPQLRTLGSPVEFGPADAA